jgi:hypothetical protein
VLHRLEGADGWPNCAAARVRQRIFQRQPGQAQHAGQCSRRLTVMRPSASASHGHARRSGCRGMRQSVSTMLPVCDWPAMVL